MMSTDSTSSWVLEPSRRFWAATESSDVDYSLLLDGRDTTHHFAVTEVYVADGGSGARRSSASRPWCTESPVSGRGASSVTAYRSKSRLRISSSRAISAAPAPC